MINFKTEHIRIEWNSGKLDNRLKLIVLAVAEKLALDYNCVLFITSIFRKGDKGVHGAWRGVDIRSHNLLAGEAQDLTDWINKNYIYDSERPSIPTALFHTVGGESQLHIHLQTCYGKTDQWK